MAAKSKKGMMTLWSVLVALVTIGGLIFGAFLVFSSPSSALSTPSDPESDEPSPDFDDGTGGDDSAGFWGTTMTGWSYALEYFIWWD